MIEIKNVTFKYESGSNGGLKNLNLNIKKGEVVLLCGESGCGKTTLTRLINGLIPHYFEGILKGKIFIDGKDISKMPLHETAKIVGSVFQNPRSQFFNVDTNSELVFGCENQGLPHNEIVNRMQHTIQSLSIESLMDRSIFKLSGGEKQKIACGCVHVVSPDIIILDEPSSNLDSNATWDLANIIASWKEEGKTIVIAEHRLYYLRDIADRMVFMQNGEIKKDIKIEEAKNLTLKEFHEYGLRPLSLEGLTCENGYINKGDNLIKLSNFNFKYKNKHHALALDFLSVPKGRIIAIVGKNGAGKSTFAKCLCGLCKGFKGKVSTDNKIYGTKECLKNAYMVMQDVNHQLFCESVLDEVFLSMNKQNVEKAEEILNSLNLLEMKDLHPISLSGGQKQRVAVATAIASEREIIVFDEPTSGLDFKHMKQVSHLIKDLRNKGRTIFIISHDIEFILETCDYMVHFEDGCASNWSEINEEYLFKLFA